MIVVFIHLNRAFSLRCRMGTAATEFAILLPLLILLGVAGIDMGRLALIAIAIENAAHVGVERGAAERFTPDTYNDWKMQIEESVLADLNDLNENWFSGLMVETTVAPPNPQTQLAWVDVVVQCNFYTIIDWPMLPQVYPIQRHASMQQYR